MARIMKMLLAVDGSRHTRRMLTYVVSNELLFRPDYGYVLFHAHDDDPDRSAGAAQILEESREFMRHHGFEPRCMQMPGDPASLLVRVAAELQCNLLIMGSRGQSPLESMVLGSVTASVLERSHVPVLVVR